MAVSQRTKDKALAALDGMREIVRGDMLDAGEYVSQEIVCSRRSLCGGRRFCAVGALWVGAGIKPERLPASDGSVFTVLPGVTPSERQIFLRHRPGLRLAYEKLNEVATKRLAALDPDGGPYYSRSPRGTLEALFEDYWPTGDLTRKDLLGVIASAKRLVKATG